MSMQRRTRFLPTLLLAASVIAHAEGTVHERLRHAMLMNDYPQAERLAPELENPDLPLADGSSLLAWAVDMQDSRMVSLLLEAGADPDAFTEAASAPLLVACQNGNTAVLAALLKAKADVNVIHPEGMTSALAICGANAAPDIVEQMIDKGAEVEHRNVQGQTPLMWAAQAGNVDNIRTLLAHGANIESTTINDLTPLFFALKSGEPAAVQALVAAGANVNQVAADGTTSVQMAMYQGSYEFATMMVNEGRADLTAFDRNGNQLLHAAVLAKQPELVALLLKREAKVDALTGPSQVTWRYEGNFRDALTYVAVPKSPMQLAEQLKHEEIMKLLLDAGATPTPPEPEAAPSN